MNGNSHLVIQEPDSLRPSQKPVHTVVRTQRIAAVFFGIRGCRAYAGAIAIDSSLHYPSSIALHGVGSSTLVEYVHTFI